MAISITIISDTHGNHKKLNLPGGDILLHCGDFTTCGSHDETVSFLSWFDQQLYEDKVYIAGNHDRLYEIYPKLRDKLVSFYPEIYYLQDSYIKIKGLKIYGSPWQPEFCHWAFNLPRKGPELQAVWDKIPRDTDILMTHTAPYSVLDPNFHYQSVGDELLLNAVIETRPKIHCFGHLHNGYGREVMNIGEDYIRFINASICNDGNIVVNEPVTIQL